MRIVHKTFQWYWGKKPQTIDKQIALKKEIPW